MDQYFRTGVRFSSSPPSVRLPNTTQKWSFIGIMYMPKGHATFFVACPFWVLNLSIFSPILHLTF